MVIKSKKEIETELVLFLTNDEETVVNGVVERHSYEVRRLAIERAIAQYELSHCDDDVATVFDRLMSDANKFLAQAFKEEQQKKQKKDNLKSTQDLITKIVSDPDFVEKRQQVKNFMKKDASCFAHFADHVLSQVRASSPEMNFEQQEGFLILQEDLYSGLDHHWKNLLSRDDSLAQWEKERGHFKNYILAVIKSSLDKNFKMMMDLPIDQMFEQYSSKMNEVFPIMSADRISQHRNNNTEDPKIKGATI